MLASLEEHMRLRSGSHWSTGGLQCMRAVLSYRPSKWVWVKILHEIITWQKQIINIKAKFPGSWQTMIAKIPK
jgi:hypothetical protein